MKIILFVLFLFVAGMSASYAQQGSGDPAAMMQRMKERLKPGLVEQVKLTEAEADKVIEINFEARSQMRGLRELGEEDRKKKMDEISTDLAKKYKAIPLTDEQVKSVQAFFEEQRKQMQQQRGQ
jgi:Spy/CpxP family protein refolding chaperone